MVAAMTAAAPLPKSPWNCIGQVGRAGPGNKIRVRATRTFMPTANQDVGHSVDYPALANPGIIAP